MALMWPMGHGDSREGGNPLPPKNLDSRLRGSDGLVFIDPIYNCQVRNITE